MIFSTLDKSFIYKFSAQTFAVIQSYLALTTLRPHNNNIHWFVWKKI